MISPAFKRWIRSIAAGPQNHQYIRHLFQAIKMRIACSGRSTYSDNQAYLLMAINAIAAPQSNNSRMTGLFLQFIPHINDSFRYRIKRKN
jgi:hypothetical protein